MKFILVKYHKKSKKKLKSNYIFNQNAFNLLLGLNSLSNEKIFITEKGLYQNILVTGTIGSRKNCILYVSVS